MQNRRQLYLQLSFLMTILGLIIWSVIWFQEKDVYEQLFQWLGTSKEYITVIYNLILMTMSGFVLSMIMDRIMHLFGYNIKKIEHFDKENERDKIC
jgi:hypothetical protein